MYVLRYLDGHGSAALVHTEFCVDVISLVRYSPSLLLLLLLLAAHIIIVVLLCCRCGRDLVLEAATMNEAPH